MYSIKILFLNFLVYPEKKALIEFLFFPAETNPQ